MSFSVRLGRVYPQSGCILIKIDGHQAPAHIGGHPLPRGSSPPWFARIIARTTYYHCTYSNLFQLDANVSGDSIDWPP